MILFFALSGLLLTGALAILLPPLIRRRAGSADPGALAASNRAIYAEQLGELDAELSADAISREHWSASREEIERRVLEESGQAHAAALGGRSAGAAMAIGAAVPVAALAFYILVGSPQALDPGGNVPQRAERQMPTAEQLDGMVAKLAARLASEQDDTEGWIVLARAQAVLGRHPEAAAAYAIAAAQRPDDARLLADYAEALAIARGRDFSGEPEKLIARALKADGKNVKALTMAGTRAFQREDYRGAMTYWQRLLPLAPEGSEFAKSVRAGIAEAERKLAATDKSGAKLPAGDTARKIP